MKMILIDYIVTFGWAIVGSLAMGVGLAISLTLFHKTTKEINEWEELKKGNIGVAIVMAAIILACAWVVSSIIRP